MVFSELKKSLQDGVKPIYQIYGKDAFLRENALRLLKEGFLSEPDLNLNNYLGQDVKEDYESFCNACRSYPFMSDKRFIVVRDYSPTQKELLSKQLKPIFTEPEEMTVIIIINEKKCEALSKLPTVTSVDCEKAEEDLIVRWIRAEGLKNKVIFSKESCLKLIDYCSYDMTKISTETFKLISFVGQGGEVSVNTISEISTKDTDFEIYELTNYIAENKKYEVFNTLKEMLNKNQDKQRLFISIYYHFRRLLHASISNSSDSELASNLGVKDFAIKKARQQAKKFTPKRLKEICDKLSYYDGAFKSGEVTLDTALWNSIFSAIIS